MLFGPMEKNESLLLPRPVLSNRKNRIRKRGSLFIRSLRRTEGRNAARIPGAGYDSPGSGTCGIANIRAFGVTKIGYSVLTFFGATAPKQRRRTMLAGKKARLGLNGPKKKTPLRRGLLRTQLQNTPYATHALHDTIYMPALCPAYDELMSLEMGSIGSNAHLRMTVS